MFALFARKASLIRQVEDLEKERDKLRDERDNAQGELSKFQATKKMEEEEIKHHLKMEQERAGLERLQHEAKVAKEKDAEVAAVKDKYRDKMENELRDQIKRGEELYKAILARLPDVNVKLRGSVR